MLFKSRSETGDRGCRRYNLRQKIFLYVSACGFWLCLVILCLLFISGFAGFLPVVSWVLALKSLIINGSRFCRFACFLSESGFSGFLDLQDVVWMGAVVILSYLVFGSFLVLPVFCRCFHGFWHLSR